MKHFAHFVFAGAVVMGLYYPLHHIHDHLYPKSDYDYCALHIDFPFNPDMSGTERLAFPFLEN